MFDCGRCIARWCVALLFWATLSVPTSAWSAPPFGSVTYEFSVAIEPRVMVGGKVGKQELYDRLSVVLPLNCVCAVPLGASPQRMLITAKADELSPNRVHIEQVLEEQQGTGWVRKANGTRTYQPQESEIMRMTRNDNHRQVFVSGQITSTSRKSADCPVY